MVEKIEFLVEEGVLSKEAVARLKTAWVVNIDELYSRIRACEFSNSAEMKVAMEKELGIKPGSLNGFRKYIEKYTSLEVVNAQKPKEYPLGARQI